MGLAASQARFLQLTARKSDIEFQGQQINQQRTLLAQKTSNLFDQMLAMPTPSVSSYATSASDVPVDTNGDPVYDADHDWHDVLTWDSSSSQTQLIPDADGDSVNDHYQEDLMEYNRIYNQLNLETEAIQEKDKVLEVKLRNLDSQQRAVQTEIEAVQKVIDKNIEMTFKTFA